MTTYTVYRIHGLKTFPSGGSVKSWGRVTFISLLIIFFKKLFLLLFEVDLALQTANFLLFSSSQGPCYDYFL